MRTAGVTRVDDRRSQAFTELQEWRHDRVPRWASVVKMLAGYGPSAANCSLTSAPMPRNRSAGRRSAAAVGPVPGGAPDPDQSGLFEFLDAGKRGAISTSPATRSAAARGLIADADVLIDASAPGTLAAFRDSHDSSWLSCRSAFGRRGPFGIAMPRR